MPSEIQPLYPTHPAIIGGEYSSVIHHPTGVIEHGGKMFFLQDLPERVTPSERLLFQRFGEFAAIPRDSGNEAEARGFVERFALERGFMREIDSAGNIIVDIPATEGYESAPGIVLQSHLDMVCASGEGKKDPAVYGVEPHVDETGEWIETDGTTLGADGALGVAAAMALVHDEIPHGNLKLLYTVREELGLHGVLEMNFKKIDTSGDRFLINLDGEKEAATISSTGSAETHMRFGIEREDVGDRVPIRISVSGLPGGHSATKIATSVSAIKEMHDVLQRMTEGGVDVRIMSVTAGNIRRTNMIPDECIVEIAIPNAQLAQMTDSLNDEVSTFSTQDRLPESTQIGHESLAANDADEDRREMLTAVDSDRIMRVLGDVPHGVIKYSEEIADMIQVSTNLATVSTGADVVELRSLSRSAEWHELQDFRTGPLETLARHLGADIHQERGYTGWKANPHSGLVEMVRQEYERITGQELPYEHELAGLETGVILGNEKFSHLEGVALGARLEDIHSITERMEIDSVSRFYALLKAVIERVARDSSSASLPAYRQGGTTT